MSRGKRNTSNEVIDVERLESFSERYERLHEDVKIAQEALKDLLTEIKSIGYNTKQFKKAMQVKEIGYENYQIEDEEFQLYLRGVGAMAKREPEPVY